MTTKQKLILADVDGVLLNWHADFRKWMRLHGYSYMEPRGQVEYCLSSRYGVTPSQANELIEAFNSSSMMRSLEPWPDSVKNVRKLTAAGYKFSVITAMGGISWSHTLRRKNLETAFGKDTFQDFFFVPLNSSKDAILEKYADTGCWWIEDKTENAIAGLKFGLRPILLRHDHNGHITSHDGLAFADDWDHIYSHVTGE